MDNYYVSKTFLRTADTTSADRTMRMVHRAECVDQVIEMVKSQLAVVLYDEVLISIRRVDAMLSKTDMQVI